MTVDVEICMQLNCYLVEKESIYWKAITRVNVCSPNNLVYMLIQPKGYKLKKLQFTRRN